MKNFVLIIKKNILPIGAGFITATLLLLTFLQVPSNEKGICIYVTKDRERLVSQNNVSVINHPTNPKLIEIKSTTIKDMDSWFRNNACNINYIANRTFLKNLHFVNDFSVIRLIDSSIKCTYTSQTIFYKLDNNERYGNYLSLDNNIIVKDSILINGKAQLSAPAIFAILDGLTNKDKIEFAKYTNRGVEQIGVKITKQNNTTSEYYNFSTDPRKPYSPTLVNFIKNYFSK